MTRTALTLLFALGLATPALAQTDCLQDINQVRAAAEASQLSDQERGELDAALVQAEQQAQAGDEETCAALVQQIRAEYNL